MDQQSKNQLNYLIMMLNSIEAIIRALDEAKIRYLIVGGLAVVAHGFVRFTADLDIVLDMEKENLQRAVTVFSTLGYKPHAPVPIEQFADAKKREEWISKKGLTVFSLWNPEDPFTEVDLFVREPFDDFARAHNNALRLKISGELTAAIVGIDDLIKLKQQACRPKDLIDIEKLKLLKDENGE
ncbi:MAG: nucleotidyltransferase family protein [Proteobacteria bacterium]|nr:nucleotidyltransferase family protein [Pseudomonadota bacterium]